MTWNYRIIRDKDGVYGIHEVYYKKGKIDMWSDAMTPLGESIDELKEDLDMMAEAFKKPVLEDDKLTQ